MATSPEIWALIQERSTPLPARVRSGGLKLVEKIKASKKELNLANAETARLKAALNQLTFEMNQSAPNQTTVRQAVSSIRNVAEGAVGSLAATGILFELSKLFS